MVPEDYTAKSARLDTLAMPHKEPLLTANNVPVPIQKMEESKWLKGYDCCAYNVICKVK